MHMILIEVNGIRSPFVVNGIFLSSNLLLLLVSLLIIYAVQTDIPTNGPTYGPTNVSCATTNGGCDFRVSCNVTVNEVVCGPCPNGTHGQGDTGCIRMFLYFFK